MALLRLCALALCSCFLLCLETSTAAAFPPIPIPEDWDLPPSVTEPDTAQPVGGIHAKLSADIRVNKTSVANLKQFSLSAGDDEELYIVMSSGFDNINGIFRPSNGLYLLSCLVHVSVKPQDEAAAAPMGTEDVQRATLTFCINGNCGSSAVLKSSSVLLSSGETITLSLSGVLQLRRGQEVTLQLENHSKDRQMVISDQSTLMAYQLRAQD